MSEAVLSLGSNLGNRKYNISMAIRALGNVQGIDVIYISRLYETEPFEVEDEQPNYINCCMKLQTRLQAHMLLGVAWGIEAAMGRTRKKKNEPRAIDIDLVLYDARVYNTKDLTLPHPRALDRAFVLVPLKDLYPRLKTPSFDFADALYSLDTSTVKPLTDT